MAEGTQQNPTPAPLASVGTKAADPTLGLLPHAISVGVGLLAGYLSTHFSVTLSADSQAEIAAAVGTVAGSGVHYLMALLSAKSKGA